MVDFRDFVSELMSKAPPSEKNNIHAVISFFVDNDWFGDKPAFKDGHVLLDDTQVQLYTDPLRSFLSENRNISVLLEKLTAKLPITAKNLQEFSKDLSLPATALYFLLDFILFRLEKELFLHDDNEIVTLLSFATMDMTKAHGDLLTFFLAWLLKKKKTRFKRNYVMEKRYTMELQSQAYSFDEYLELMYYLFNEAYIESNEMYSQAAASKNFTDTWLFLSLHFICSLRYTDLKRIYHPDLPYPPEEVLQRIHDGTFSGTDCKLVLLSITTRMCLLPFVPNKTAAASGIASVKFHIPASCENHFGMLFALAEAHFQLAGADGPLIRNISSYEDINRYMGEEIGNLFLFSNFRPRSATKSYLQAIDLLADDILDEQTEGPSIKGYLLAALARSHKGSYGEFAATTFEYLKDAKLSGLTPEFVAFELLERGALSFVAADLLKIITGNAFSRASVSTQTALIKELRLRPREIEGIVSAVSKGKAQAQKTVSSLIASDADVLNILHRIGSGEAFAKIPESLCLITACGKLCPYSDRKHCVGCEFEVSTKSTFYLMLSEYKRLKLLYGQASSSHEKEKYVKIVRAVLLPKLDEMLSCIKETYGDATFSEYEEILKGFTI